MKKLFISQPMRGKTDEEILKERKEAIEAAERILGEEVEVIDSFFEKAPVDAKPLWFLGKSIELLSDADIVFFANTYTTGISHVGIYAGNGQFIHAPNSRSTVSYSDLTSGYWAEHYYGARRVAS